MSSNADDDPSNAAGGAGAFAYQAELNAIIAASKGNRPWYERLNLSRYLNVKYAYLGVSVMSFMLMAIFGFVNMYVTEDCIIEDPPPARCCSCVKLNDTQLFGQTIPRQRSFNSVYYGVVMVINSVFGMYYVVVGLRNENKYQLFCMLITQLLECARGLGDSVLEPKSENEVNRPIREGLMYAALALCLISGVLVRPVYKVFGWAIFRRGGAKHSTRQMYKRFQLFRALNRLDVQSSFMIFIIFILYLDTIQRNWWVFAVLGICDIIASRSMVRCLKQESKAGFYVSTLAKLYVTIYWIVVLVDYEACYERYELSREVTTPWWTMDRAPDFQSVYASYNGLSCLAPLTVHDARTKEVIILNFVQALLFRLGSIVASTFVLRNFGKGLKGVFYKLEEAKGSTATAAAVAKKRNLALSAAEEFKPKSMQSMNGGSASRVGGDQAARSAADVHDGYQEYAEEEEEDDEATLREMAADGED